MSPSTTAWHQIDFEFKSTDIQPSFVAPVLDEQTWFNVSIRAYDSDMQSYFRSVRLHVIPEFYWVEVEKLFPGDITAAKRKDGSIRFDDSIHLNDLPRRLASPESIKFITNEGNIVALINSDQRVEVIAQRVDLFAAIEALQGVSQIALGNRYLLAVLDDASVRVFNTETVNSTLGINGLDLSGIIEAKSVAVTGLTPLIINKEDNLYGLCGDDLSLLLLAKNVKQVDGQFLLLNDNRVVKTPSCEFPETYIAQGFEGVEKIEKITYSFEIKHSAYLLALLEDGSVVNATGKVHLGLTGDVVDISHGAALMSNGDIFNLTEMRVIPSGESKLNLKYE